jgi:hypothetical protein
MTTDRLLTPHGRGHYVSIQTRTDLDDELRGWLQEAHDVVGLQAGLADRAGRRPRASPGDGKRPLARRPERPSMVQTSAPPPSWHSRWPVRAG